MPQYQILYEHGVLMLGSLTFRWLAIPFIQHEPNNYIELHNTTKRRVQKHKVVPQGVIPQQMFMRPETVDSHDFKVSL